MSEPFFLFYLSFLHVIYWMTPYKRKLRLNRTKDIKAKFLALRAACPDLKIKKIRMTFGGWNIVFIINNKYAFKVRKRPDTSDIERLIKEKRITETFAKIVPLKIPKVEIIHAGPFVFSKYEFIDGVNLTTLPLKTIIQHRKTWTKQIAQFIFAMHTVFPENLEDLKFREGDSWGHNDICNNMIVDPKTMKIIGIIDWEYSNWNFLETEFKNCTVFSPKLQQAGYDPLIRAEYAKLLKKHK